MLQLQQMYGRDTAIPRMQILSLREMPVAWHGITKFKCVWDIHPVVGLPFINNVSHNSLLVVESLVLFSITISLYQGGASETENPAKFTFINPCLTGRLDDGAWRIAGTMEAVQRVVHDIYGDQLAAWAACMERCLSHGVVTV